MENTIEKLAKMSISQYEFFVEEVFEDELKKLNGKECNKFLHNKYQIRLNKNGIKLFRLYEKNLQYEKIIREKVFENKQLNQFLESRNKEYSDLALLVKKTSIARNLAI